MQVRTGLLPAWATVLQWRHSLDNSQPLGQPENMPEVEEISFSFTDGQENKFQREFLSQTSENPFFVWSVHTTISSSLYNHVPQTQTGIYLHDVEEHFLAQAVLLFKEFVFGVSTSDVSANQLLAGWRHLQQFRVLILDGHILGIAQQLPHYRPKVVRNPFSDKILWEKKRTGTLWNCH